MLTSKIGGLVALMGLGPRNNNELSSRRKKDLSHGRAHDVVCIVCSSLAQVSNPWRR